MKRRLTAEKTPSVPNPPDEVQCIPSKEIGLPESGRMEGQAARAMGLEITENPYRRVEPEDLERFKPLAEEWEAGWNEAQNPRDVSSLVEVDRRAPQPLPLQSKQSETKIGKTWAIVSAFDRR